MKCFRCFCCLFLVCVLSLSVFSSSVKAAEDNTNLIVDHVHLVGNDKFGFLSFRPNNNTVEKLETEKTYTTLPTSYENRLQIRNSNGEVLVKEGKRVTVSVNNFYYSVLYKTSYIEGDGVAVDFTYLKKPDTANVKLVYSDGTYGKVDSEFVDFYMRGDKIVNMSVDFIAIKDVDYVMFSFYSDLNASAPTKENVIDYKLTFYSGEFDGDDKYQVNLEIVSKEAEWLEKIHDKQDEELGFLDSILQTIKNVFNAIIELPQKIANFIIDGIKSLFIPSDDFIVEFKEDMDSLLAEKFGAVYQVVDILANTWDSIQESAVSQTVKFPEVSINLPGDNVFKFGGYDVKVVPEGFEFIVVSVKLITGIIATLFFVNGLKKRYDEIIGG